MLITWLLENHHIKLMWEKLTQINQTSWEKRANKSLERIWKTSLKTLIIKLLERSTGLINTFAQRLLAFQIWRLHESKKWWALTLSMCRMTWMHRIQKSGIILGYSKMQTTFMTRSKIVICKLRHHQKHELLFRVLLTLDNQIEMIILIFHLQSLQLTRWLILHWRNGMTYCTERAISNFRTAKRSSRLTRCPYLKLTVTCSKQCSRKFLH